MIKIIKGAKKAIVIENNKTSQLNSLIREHCLLSVDNKVLKYDGRPFSPQDISECVEEIIKSMSPKTIEMATFGRIDKE